MGERSRIYRALEMIPATFTWGTLLGAVLLSWAKPVLAFAFILAFDLYWLLRVTYFIFYLIVAWLQYRHKIAVPWWERLRVSELPWQGILHIIFLPTYKESVSVIRKTLSALAEVHYDTKRFLIVLAGEERDREHFLHLASILQKEYHGVFFDFLTSLHPKDLPDEIPGKGSNLHYAGGKVAEYLRAKEIPYQQCIVSAFDIDTIVHPDYFAYLTHTFLTTPDRERASYQPVALYNNNIWESNPLVRIAAFGTTFWLMTELPRPERLFTFSSHSMSWQALSDVGFWERRIVTEDSRIFLQCFIHYNGAYRVQPLYLPVSMNTVMVGSVWRSLVNLYRQQRRWAWGIEHFPYMVRHFFFTKNSIPFRKKIYYLWNLGEGMYSWATAPLLIFLLGRLPFYFADEEVRRSALYNNAPFMLEGLLQLAMVGIFVSAILSLLLLPKHRDYRHPPRPVTSNLTKHQNQSFASTFFRWGCNGVRSFIMIAQWLLLPVTLIFFGSIPAIEAQTRLALGKRLGFWVTEKT